MREMNLTVSGEHFEWINEPASAALEVGVLRFRSKPETDFWQKTLFGFQRDDGHMFCTAVRGDFDAACTVNFTPNSQYDQAGLVVRVDAHTWLKVSVEYNGDKPAHLGCVITNHGFSDWSLQEVGAPLDFITYEVECRGGDLQVFVKRTHSAKRELIRVGHLHGTSGETETMVGPYGCSPDGPGCDVTVTDFTLRPVAAA